ncbi:hypothetical protein ACF0H5_021471 [Mactra antiquata]
MSILARALHIVFMILGNIWFFVRDYIAVPLRLANPQDHRSRADEILPNEVRQKWEREQDELQKKLILKDNKCIKEMFKCHKVKDCKDHGYYIAGVDISFVKDDLVNACAGLVVLRFPSLKLVYEDYKMVELTEPYIPGFLAFREAPFIVDLFDTLKQTKPKYYPHLVMVDGNGILHPKEFGSACHVGVLLDLPCIGVAKKLFQVGGLENNQEHKEKIKQLKKGGATFPLVVDSGRTLGMALRSHDGCTKPIYVSPGHLVTVETAVKLVHCCCLKRVPEPVRLADINSREYIRQNFKPTTDNQAT